MKIARIEVSSELLRSALALPGDAIIIDARPSEKLNAIELKIQCEQLDDVPEGSIIPKTTPVLSRTILPCGCEKTEWLWRE